jgi:hypothetical protein
VRRRRDDGHASLLQFRRELNRSHGLLTENSLLDLFERDGCLRVVGDPFIATTNAQGHSIQVPQRQEWQRHELQRRRRHHAVELYHEDHGTAILPAHPFQFQHEREWLGFLATSLLFFVTPDQAAKHAEQCGLASSRLLKCESAKFLSAAGRRLNLSKKPLARNRDEAPDTLFEDYVAFDSDDVGRIKVVAVRGDIPELGLIQ